MNLEQLKSFIEKEYEKQTWSGVYDGSRGEAYEDGLKEAKTKTLYKIGTLIGLTLVPLPDFDLEASEFKGTWTGKNGFTPNSDEDN